MLALRCPQLSDLCVQAHSLAEATSRREQPSLSDGIVLQWIPKLEKLPFQI